MWLSDRRKFLAWTGAALLALPGCQLTPVYAPNGSGSKLQSRIFIQEPVSEEHYFLVRHLESRLGRADPAPLELSYSYSSGTQGLGATALGYNTRVHRTGTVTFSLKNSDTGDVIDAGRISRFVGYAATGNTASTLAAERESMERLAIVIGDALIDRLHSIDPTKLP